VPRGGAGIRLSVVSVDSVVIWGLESERAGSGMEGTGRVRGSRVTSAGVWGFRLGLDYKMRLPETVVTKKRNRIKRRNERK
jgi:hypothetical protein